MRVKRKHFSNLKTDHCGVICETAAVKDAKFSSCGVVLNPN